MQVWQAKELLRKNAQFVRSQSADSGKTKLKEGVYPPVAMESVRKVMKMKEMKCAPLDYDGD